MNREEMTKKRDIFQKVCRVKRIELNRESQVLQVLQSECDALSSQLELYKAKYLGGVETVNRALADPQRLGLDFADLTTRNYKEAWITTLKLRKATEDKMLAQRSMVEQYQRQVKLMEGRVLDLSLMIKKDVAARQQAQLDDALGVRIQRRKNDALK